MAHHMPTVARSLLLASALAALAPAAQAQAVSNPYDITRTSSFTYFTSGVNRGLLQTETIEPDQPGQCVVTTHSYDAFGNKSGASVANCTGATGRAVFTARSSSSSSYGAQTVTIDGNSSVAIPAGTVATSASNALGHSETRQYDPRFGAVTRLTGPNSLATVQTLDAFGRVIRETRADGTRSETEHCLITGRASNTTSNSDGCGTTPSLSGRSDEIPASAFSYLQTVAKDAAGAVMGPVARVYKDRAGRTVREIAEIAPHGDPSQPSNRRWVVKDTEYSATGVAVVKTQPYFLESKSSTLTGSNDYGLEVTTVDALGRPTRVDVADAQGNIAQSSQYGRSRKWARTSIAYAGLVVTSTNAKGQTRKEEKNVDGKVVRVTDAYGAQLAHQFDAVGNLLQTKDALQNLVILSYDNRGRKLSLKDPDTGHWEYDYNALGELVWQRSPNQRASNSQTTMAYDTLGRMTQRAEPEYTSTWYHDRDAAGALCGKGTGKLCESITSHGVTKKHHYDTKGRPDWSRTLVSGGPSFETWLAYSITTGRVSRQMYPTRLAVDYAYSGYGALRQVKLANAATLNPLPASAGGTPGASQAWAAGKVLWTAGSVTAWGKPATAELGNGVQARNDFDAATGRVLGASAGPGSAKTAMDHAYTWDALNNLASRIDSIGDGLSGAVSETYAYDSLNRLTGYTVAAPAVPNLARSVTLTYNAIGNLLYKSDVGNYSYPAYGNSGGVTRVRPHAVSRVAGTSFGTVDYGYDANGNAITANGGKWRSIAYTSFNLPDSQNGIGGPGGAPRSTWQYDENHQRIRETRSNAAGTRSTWYQHPDNQGGLAFESETAPDGARSQRHYVAVGAQTVVLVSTAALPTLGAPGSAMPAVASVVLVKQEFWLKDHLGSVTATLDHAGVVTARHAYDPFGKRRQTDGRYDAFGTLVIDWADDVNRGTDRGFTGHEHLDDLGLVHMNGRIYDPTIARFLQGDPFVQAPDELQNYNRYSYCYNNGLNCTDPTGYFSLKKLLKAVVVVAIAVFAAPVIANWAAFAAVDAGIMLGSEIAFGKIVGGAVAGFASGAVQGGNLRSGVQGALSGGLFGAAGSVGAADSVGRYAAHSAAGCIAAAAGGGKCGSGALSAVVGKYTSNKLNAHFGGGPSTGKFVATTIAGGAASTIGGGKFDSGAVTAAFGYLFNECLQTRMCGSGSTKVEIQGNVAGGDLGNRTDPRSLHLSVSISDGYAGLTVLNGQPRGPGWFCMLCLNSEATAAAHGPIVWGPHALAIPAGMTSTSFANALVGATNQYANYLVPYSMPSLPSGAMNSWQFNSNSWVAGLLYSVTGGIPAYTFAPDQAPGYANPVPSWTFRKRR